MQGQFQFISQVNFNLKKYKLKSIFPQNKCSGLATFADNCPWTTIVHAQFFCLCKLNFHGQFKKYMDNFFSPCCNFQLWCNNVYVSKEDRLKIHELGEKYNLNSFVTEI